MEEKQQIEKSALIWLYEFIIKQTKEDAILKKECFDLYHLLVFEKEINRLLIKYNCEPLD